MAVAQTIRRRVVPIWPELSILAAVLAAFEPTLAATAHIPYDAELYHFPLLRTVQEQLSSGTLPRWDSYSYGGMPLLANAQSAWVYPPHLMLDAVLTIIGQPLTEHALDVLVVAHFALAGLGIAAVARGRGLGRAAAAFAGIFVVLNGEVVAQTQHIGQVEAFAWMPLTILAIDRIRMRGLSARRIIAVAACFAMMISAGFLPVVFACAAVLAGIALVHGPSRLRILLGVAAGLALGAAMAAVVLLPVLGVLSTFPQLEAHAALPWAGVVTSIFPNAFGHWQPSASEFRGLHLTDSYYYVGASVLLLLPLALMSGREALADAVFVLVLLLASFGGPGEHIASAIQSLPTVGLLWRPENILYLAMIPLALLLARGLARPPTGRALAISGVLIVLVALVTFTAQAHHLHLLSDAPRRSLLALLVTAVLLSAAALMRSRPDRRRASAVCLALAALAAGADVASAVPDRYFVNASGAATNAGPNQTGVGSPQVLTVLREHLSSEGRIDTDIDSLPAQWAGFAPIWHLSVVNGFQPEFSKYQLARVKATGAEFEGRTRTFPLTPAAGAYLHELGVEYLVLSTANDRFAGAAGYQLVFADPVYRVYRVLNAGPHAYAVGAQCLLSVNAWDSLACRTGPMVHVTRTAAARRTLTILPKAPSALVLITGEPWYPGWHASSSSGSLPVSRVGFQAAVSVPAGTTKVYLAYSPPGLLAGVVLSLLSIGASVLVLARGRRSRADARGGSGPTPNASSASG